LDFAFLLDPALAPFDGTLQRIGSSERRGVFVAKNLSLRDQYGRYLNLIKATMTAMFRFQHRLADSVKTYRYLIPSLKKLNLVGLITGTDSLAAILKYFFYSLQEALSDGGGGGGDENCTDKILSWPRIRLALAHFCRDIWKDWGR